MRTSIRILFLFMCLFLLAMTASAQATRVKFPPGAKSVIVTGRLTDYKGHQAFLVKVKKGQRLSTENAGKHYITVEIRAPKNTNYDPDMAADCHDRHTVDPTAEGDYKIIVFECQKADPWRGNFKLRIRVR